MELGTGRKSKCKWNTYFQICFNLLCEASALRVEIVTPPPCKLKSYQNDQSLINPAFARNKNRDLPFKVFDCSWQMQTELKIIIYQACSICKNHLTVWPSGLRRETQVLVEQSAWVRTPQLSFLFVFFYDIENMIFCFKKDLHDLSGRIVQAQFLAKICRHFTLKMAQKTVKFLTTKTHDFWAPKMPRNPP